MREILEFESIYSQINKRSSQNKIQKSQKSNTKLRKWEGLTAKWLRIKLPKWNLRSSEKVFKLKYEKFNNSEQDNKKLRKEAHTIRFRSPKSRIQSQESGSD